MDLVLCVFYFLCFALIRSHQPECNWSENTRISVLLLDFILIFVGHKQFVVLLDYERGQIFSYSSEGMLVRG